MRSRFAAALIVLLAVSGGLLAGACEDKKAAADTHVKKGTELVAQGKFDEAIVELKKAADLNQDSMQARLQLGNAYRGLKKYDDAFAAYRDAKKVDRYVVAPHIAQAEMQIELGKVDTATNELNHVIELEPTNLQALILLGKVSMMPLAGATAPAPLSVQRAELNLDAAASLAPDNIEVHYHLAKAAEMLGHKPKAVAAWTKVADLAKGKPGAEKMAKDAADALARLK